MWYFAAFISDCFLPFPPAPSQPTLTHSSCYVPFVDVLRVAHGEQQASLRCVTPANMASFRENTAVTESTETRFYGREKGCLGHLSWYRVSVPGAPTLPGTAIEQCLLHPETLPHDRGPFIGPALVAIIRFPVYVCARMSSIGSD